jgi:hypothetical protein
MILWHDAWKSGSSIAGQRFIKRVSVTTALGNMHSHDNASLSTLVTARLICVPLTLDTMCSVFGSREVIKGEQFARRIIIPCGGAVEYLHRNPASGRRRRKRKSRIWDSKIWSPLSRQSDPKMTALARTRSSCKRQTRPLVREIAPHQQTRNWQ